jgi:hypothetical protein
MQKLYL